MAPGAFQMRLEESVLGPAGTEVRCGGFQVLFDEDAPLVRLVPGERPLAGGMTAAVILGLREAPRLLSEALRVHPPARPYDRVEVALGAGALTQGEASSIADGCIRLFLGERAPAGEAAKIACHEALHLLLAAGLSGGERWNDPELAFADWIVRGIEGGLDAELPRFHAPLPQLLDPVPASRLEVQRQLATVASAPGAARRHFGEPLFAGLHRLELEAEGHADRATLEQRQLWLVEAALGTHYLEAAGRVEQEHGDGLRAVVLDDWLIDYEQYVRAVGNAPAGPGNLWRLSETGWSRDPVVRLSVVAQVLQRDDQCFFAGDRFSHADEPVIWKSRGRVRLPLLPSPPRPRPSPIHGFRAVLRDLDAPDVARATALVEQAVRGGADRFEARALWPRILARLLAAHLPVPATDPAAAAAPLLQVVDSGDGVAVQEAFQEWASAAAALRALLGDRAGLVPRVAEPQHIATLAEAPRGRAAIQLVHAAPPSASSLLAARKLAAQKPVRGALFRDHLDGGKPHERLPDLEEPLDPRYREETWRSAGPLPGRLEDLPATADEDTKDGRLTTAVSHLLSMMTIGLEECHYPRPRAGAPPAARG